MSEQRCPGCGSVLHEVRQDPNSMLNAEQFDAIRAGDYYCIQCSSNGRGNTSYRYWWKRELKRTAAEQAPMVDSSLNDSPAPAAATPAAPTPRTADQLLELYQDKTKWQLCQKLAQIKDERNQLERELTAAQAELQAARRDAERYRWLRNQDDQFCLNMNIGHDWIGVCGHEMDAAIDSAIAVGKGVEG